MKRSTALETWIFLQAEVYVFTLKKAEAIKKRIEFEIKNSYAHISEKHIYVYLSQTVKRNEIQ